MAKERVERDEEDLVRLYLTDIGQYPLLTKDDEVRLAQQIEARAGAEEAAVHLTTPDQDEAAQLSDADENESLEDAIRASAARGRPA